MLGGASGGITADLEGVQAGVSDQAEFCGRTLSYEIDEYFKWHHREESIFDGYVPEVAGPERNGPPTRFLTDRMA